MASAWARRPTPWFGNSVIWFRAAGFHVRKRGLRILRQAQWIAFLREHGSGMIVGHPCGSCRMGGYDGAVVDGRLRVRGARRLRVVDASIMPAITSGNANGPTFMIGEKASELILEDWRTAQAMHEPVAARTH